MEDAGKTLILLQYQEQKINYNLTLTTPLADIYRCTYMVSKTISLWV